MLRFDVPYTLSHARRVLEALVGVVEDNWTARDRWSDPRPDPPVDIEQWLPRCVPDALKYNDILGYWESDEFFFSFSPLSAYLCSILLIRDQDDRLGVSMYLAGSIRFEEEGDREQLRMEYAWKEHLKARGLPFEGVTGPEDDSPESTAWWEKWNSLDDTPKVWPRNRELFSRIVDRLTALFPVRELRINPALRDEPAGGSATQVGAGM
jgi:hypothetical protein